MCVSINKNPHWHLWQSLRSEDHTSICVVPNQIECVRFLFLIILCSFRHTSKYFIYGWIWIEIRELNFFGISKNEIGFKKFAENLNRKKFVCKLRKMCVRLWQVLPTSRINVVWTWTHTANVNDVTAVVEKKHRSHRQLCATNKYIFNVSAQISSIEQTIHFELRQLKSLVYRKDFQFWYHLQS